MKGGDETFTATCDISEIVSCSQVLTSEWSHLFSALGIITKGSMLDQSNSVLGAIFYSLMLLSATSEYAGAHGSPLLLDILLAIAVCAMSMSAVLAYILAFELQTLCPVCVLSYVCNLAIFVDCRSVTLAKTLTFEPIRTFNGKQGKKKNKPR
jgi:uncharacterized membrane protein